MAPDQCETFTPLSLYLQAAQSYSTTLSGADAASQPNDTAYYDLSDGHSTGIETISTTGSLHQRSVYRPPPLDNVTTE